MWGARGAPGVGRVDRHFEFWEALATSGTARADTGPKSLVRSIWPPVMQTTPLSSSSRVTREGMGAAAPAWPRSAAAGVPPPVTSHAVHPSPRRPAAAAGTWPHPARTRPQGLPRTVRRRLHPPAPPPPDAQARAQDLFAPVGRHPSADQLCRHWLLDPGAVFPLKAQSCRQLAGIPAPPASEAPSGAACPCQQPWRQELAGASAVREP